MTIIAVAHTTGNTAPTVTSVLCGLAFAADAFSSLDAVDVFLVECTLKSTAFIVCLCVTFTFVVVNTFVTLVGLCVPFVLIDECLFVVNLGLTKFVLENAIEFVTNDVREESGEIRYLVDSVLIEFVVGKGVSAFIVDAGFLVECTLELTLLCGCLGVAFTFLVVNAFVRLNGLCVLFVLTVIRLFVVNLGLTKLVASDFGLENSVTFLTDDDWEEDVETTLPVATVVVTFVASLVGDIVAFIKTVMFAYLVNNVVVVDFLYLSCVRNPVFVVLLSTVGDSDMVALFTVDVFLVVGVNAFVDLSTIYEKKLNNMRICNKKPQESMELSKVHRWISDYQYQQYDGGVVMKYCKF